MTDDAALPARAAVVEPGKVCASLVSKTVYADAPVVPVAPSMIFATVSVSAFPAASAMRTVIVRAVMVCPVSVTTLLAREAPVGTVAENAAPSTLYSHTVIALVPVPVTTEVAGVVAPPAAGEVST